MPSQFLTDLTWRDLGPQEYLVTAPLIYRSELLGEDITVPAGFKTDGESDPRWVPLLHSLFGDAGDCPWVVHDWLYYIGTYGRKVSDEVGLEAVKTIPGIPAWREYGIYYGLRIGGFVAWNEHRKAGHSAQDDFKKNLEIYSRPSSSQP